MAGLGNSISLKTLREIRARRHRSLTVTAQQALPVTFVAIAGLYPTRLRSRFGSARAAQTRSRSDKPKS